VSLHGKNGLGKKVRIGWHYDKILVHPKQLGLGLVSPKETMKLVHKSSFATLHSNFFKKVL
jgi:hypothetical protein